MSTDVAFKMLMEFKCIFPNEERREPSFYLRGAGKTFLLDFCTHFLGVFPNDKRLSNYKSYLETCFCPANNEYANQLNSIIKAYYGENLPKLCFTSIEAFLLIFESVYPTIDLLTENKTGVELERDVFKAILSANSIITGLDKKVAESTKHFADWEKPFKMLFTQGFRNFDIQFVNVRKTSVSQLIRAVILFDFLENCQETQQLLSDFLAKYECPNWKEYLRRMFLLGKAVLDFEGKGKINFSLTNIADKKERENASRFLSNFGIKENEAFDEDDFKSIRSNPIIKTTENNFRLIFGLFVLERIYKSCYFELNSIIKANPNKFPIVIREFKSYYGEHISEGCMLYETLKYIYGKRYKQLSGKSIKSNHKDFSGEPDYYMRNGKNIFLFECKDFSMRADLKRSADFSIYETEIKLRLLEDSRSSKIKLKAIKQLAKNIERCLNKELPFDNDYTAKNINIFPILILQDNIFNVPGFQLLIHSWFYEEISKLKRKGIDISKVRELVMIDMDTMLYFADNFKNKEINLDETIDDYLTTIRHPNYNYRTLKPATRINMTSYSAYLDSLSFKNNLRIGTGMIKEHGLKLFS